MRDLVNLGDKNKEPPLCYPYSVKARALIHAHLSRIDLPRETLAAGKCTTCKGLTIRKEIGNGKNCASKSFPSFPHYFSNGPSLRAFYATHIITRQDADFVWPMNLSFLLWETRMFPHKFLFEICSLWYLVTGLQN